MSSARRSLSVWGFVEANLRDANAARAIGERTWTQKIDESAGSRVEELRHTRYLETRRNVAIFYRTAEVSRRRGKAETRRGVSSKIGHPKIILC